MFDFRVSRSPKTEKNCQRSSLSPSQFLLDPTLPDSSGHVKKSFACFTRAKTCDFVSCPYRDLLDRRLFCFRVCKWTNVIRVAYFRPMDLAEKQSSENKRFSIQIKTGHLCAVWLRVCAWRVFKHDCVLMQLVALFAKNPLLVQYHAMDEFVWLWKEEQTNVFTCKRVPITCKRNQRGQNTRTVCTRFWIGGRKSFVFRFEYFLRLFNVGAAMHIPGWQHGPSWVRRSSD